VGQVKLVASHAHIKSVNASTHHIGTGYLHSQEQPPPGTALVIPRPRLIQIAPTVVHDILQSIILPIKQVRWYSLLTIQTLLYLFFDPIFQDQHNTGNGP
jgi:hypothetical protein